MENKTILSHNRLYAKIHQKALTHNILELQKYMPPGCHFMAVVKANAYGHGDTIVAGHLNSLGITDFAVATLEEGIRLRQENVSGQILILGYTPPECIPLLLRYDLTQTIVDEAHGQALENYLSRTAGPLSPGITFTKPLKAHIKIDTGMHRLGLPPEDLSAIKKQLASRHILVTGMFTHLCCCDSLDAKDRLFTLEQIRRFFTLADQLKKQGTALPPLHIQSSYGLINNPALPCSYARIGIMMYGCFSQKPLSLIAVPDLWPVLSLHSYVALVREVPAKDTVGYGRAYKAKTDRKIAVIPAGYGDGYPRNISGKGYVLIHGHKAPIAGRICMDQMAVDISDIPDVCTGTPVTLLGREGSEEIRAEDIAGWSGTIANEILCRLGSRIHRIKV